MMTNGKKSSFFSGFWKNYKFPAILLTSIAVGCFIGITFGEKAVVLRPFGEVFMNLLFMLVVPVVLFSVTSAIANFSDFKKLKKLMWSMFLVFAVTSTIAALCMLAAVKIFPPALGFEIEMEAVESIKTLNTSEQLVKAFTVTDFHMLLSKSHMLPLIVFCILLGIAINMMGERGRPVAQMFDRLTEAVMNIVKLVMYYAPIGLAAFFAALVGDFGPNLLGSYARSMLIYHSVLFAYYFIAFSIYAYIGGNSDGVRRFWKNIIAPSVTAVGTQSSIANLPVNLEAAARIGIPKEIREVVLPVGATAHMEAACLSGILKISFLFGLFGMPFTGWGTYATALLITVMGGVVMSGIPGGGMIAEMLIVSMYGFPPEAFGIIATIGWLVDPAATMISSCGDTASAMIITRLVEGKDWLKKAIHPAQPA